MEKIAQLLLDKEVITRFVDTLPAYPTVLIAVNMYREDMIKLLGKRPFDRADDMDKWLAENQKLGTRSAPPPLEPAEVPLPVATSKTETDQQL